MSLTNKKTVSIVILIIVLATVLAYFGKTGAPVLEIVSPRQEVPNFEEHYPGDTNLADRVTKSYGMALVLVQGPYSQKNAVAIASLRSWARDRFQREPDFLHPVTLEPASEPRSTFIEALSHSLFASFKFFADEYTGEFLRDRIADFHQSNAYLSFRKVYFDLFGIDADSAILLSRYQSDRARLAVGILEWGMLWLLGILVGIIKFICTPSRMRFEIAQRLFACAWLLAACNYMLVGCVSNEVSLVVSAVVSLLIACYLGKPFVITIDKQGIASVKYIKLPSNWIALTIWLSFSVLAIQVITWMHYGSLILPDPITLTIASFTGNFLQDPIHAKHTVMRMVGIVWLLIGLWMTTQLAGDANIARDTREGLASLKGPV